MLLFIVSTEFCVVYWHHVSVVFHFIKNKRKKEVCYTMKMPAEDRNSMVSGDCKLSPLTFPKHLTKYGVMADL